MWDYLSEGENKETTTAMESSIPKATNGASSPLLLADGEANKKKFEKAKEETVFDKRLYIVLIRCVPKLLYKNSNPRSEFFSLKGQFKKSNKNQLENKYPKIDGTRYAHGFHKSIGFLGEANQIVNKCALHAP
jgi:hypothetical protein